VICRTTDEAWQAGWDAPCEHGLGPGDCPDCALTPGEIARLVMLHRPYLQPSGPTATTAA